MYAQARSAVIAPGSDVTALGALFTELLRTKENVRHIADMMAGADRRYDSGDTHPRAGRWAPDLLLRNGNGPMRLAEPTRSARPLLLDLTEEGVLAKELSGAHDRGGAVTARAALHTALGRWFGAVARQEFVLLLSCETKGCGCRMFRLRG